MANSLLMRLVLFLGLVSFGSTAYGQNFSIPSAWRKPATSLTRGAMEEMAQSAVNTLVPLFSPGGTIPNMTNDQPAYTIAAISRTDYLSGNTTFKQLVLDSTKAVFTADPNISTVRLIHNSQVVMWGLAAASAYRAYNDSTSLGYAQATWDQVSVFQIQPSDAAKGFASAVNASIPSTCNGTTTAGGVFAYPINSTFPGASERPTDVDGETVAAFVALSGHLFEFTGDSKYLDAAASGAAFIQNHMQTPPVITDTFTVAACTTLAIPAFTYVTGFAIWGLSILATHNTSWTPFLNDLITESVPNTAWTDPNSGIVIEGPPDTNSDPVQACLKVIWIRGLHEAWTRLDPTAFPSALIKSYLYVQFNAINDLAFNPSINAYSPIWEGPPVPELLSWGQLDALDVLNSAFSMAEEPASSNTTSSSTGSGLPATAPSGSGVSAAPSSTGTAPATLTSAATANSSAPATATNSDLSSATVSISAVVGSFAIITIGSLTALY